MSITVDRRLEGSRITTQSNLSTKLVETTRRTVDSVSSYEVTRGWRTRERGDSKAPDARNVYAPPKGASLAEILKYRKDFIERTVTNLSLSSSTPAPTHFLLSDTGNEFANTKLTVVAPENEILYRTASGDRVRTRNGNPSGTRWLSSDGVTMANGNPLSDFGGYFGGKGISEFAGLSASHGLNQSAVNVINSKAISTLNPIQVHASVLTTLLELVKGDVPGLLTQLRRHLTSIQYWRSSFSDIKKAGSAVGASYLENVFGWAPIIRDVEAAIKVLATIDGLLFPEDNTRRTFDSVVSSSFGTQEGTTNWTGNFGLLNPLGGSARAIFDRSITGALGYAAVAIPCTFTARDTTDVRVTARFNTSLVPNAANNGHLDRMRELLGLRLTPEVLWDLTPWTWLIDWFANIGTVVGNLSNLHMSNVILNYAYSTFRREAVSAVWCRPEVSGSTSTGIQSFSGTFLIEYHLSQKVRFKASPYGFGTALPSLNPGQWAILVALGLARAR